MYLILKLVLNLANISLIFSYASDKVKQDLIALSESCSLVSILPPSQSPLNCIEGSPDELIKFYDKLYLNVIFFSSYTVYIFCL
jgi:hypothetical protein